MRRHKNVNPHRHCCTGGEADAGGAKEQPAKGGSAAAAAVQAAATSGSAAAKPAGGRLPHFGICSPSGGTSKEDAVELSSEDGAAPSAEARQQEAVERRPSAHPDAEEI